MKRQSFKENCLKNGIINPIKWVSNQYVKGLSCNEIAEKLLERHEIKVSAKYLAEIINKQGLTRSRSERKLNAIKRGRMIYFKKPENQLYKARGVSNLVRMQVLQRDNYTCQICGNSNATGYAVEIHYINGKERNIDNLQTLCFNCYRGLHLLKKEV